jgi:hypothetical protein
MQLLTSSAVATTATTPTTRPSDELYDKLLMHLLQVEVAYPILKVVNSPSPSLGHARNTPVSDVQPGRKAAVTLAPPAGAAESPLDMSMEGVHREGDGGAGRGVRQEKPVVHRHDLGIIFGSLELNLRLVNGGGNVLVSEMTL